MNLIERTFKEYLETFHSTLFQTAEEYFEPDLSHKLLHLSFLPAQIIGYVSTNFGIGFEYIPAKETSVKIVIGGKRVENLFINPNHLLLTSKTIFYVLGPNMKMIGSGFGSESESNDKIYNLDSGDYLPFILSKEDSSIFLNNVSIKTNARRKIVVYSELYGDSRVENWSREKAITRAKNEVLAALVDLNRSRAKGISLDEYISVHKERTVLLLGDYDEPGLRRLQVIGDAIKKIGYDPLLIKDIPDHPHQDLSQKVVAAGAVARFVIVDDSSKSGHLVEIPICKQNNWVTILLRDEGKGGTWMTAGASEFSKVILEKTYSMDSIEKDILEATLWAEETLKTLEKGFASIFPWRKADK